MLPSYLQVWGIAKNRGCAVKTFHLREDLNWAPDLAELESVTTKDTKLIAVCNPNNPTGRILTEVEMDQIVAVAAKVGAWILADEVYRGANRVSDEENPSFYGRYERVIAVNSMSKAYGLPGLRIGWAVGMVAAIDDIWARHEYTTISAALLSSKLAALALSPGIRPQLLRRTREFIRSGYATLERWLRDHGDTFHLHPPDAAAIAFVRYDIPLGSTEFAERLRREKSVLIVPGDHFGLDRFVRISFGLPEDYLVLALDRIHDLILQLKGGSQWSPRPQPVQRS
jgi:aspartate/methionine/tyrosine aminotransferase